MNKQTLYRGKKTTTKKWVFGSPICNKDGQVVAICQQLENPVHLGVITGWVFGVIPETVGQFTGFSDKNKRSIYKGDYVLFKIPYRTTQTHTGDNIPNGSYTEPMEPGIKFIEGEVKYENGMFFIDYDENNDSDFRVPMALNYLEFWDLEMIKDSISYSPDDADLFYDPEEGDLQYLIKEVVKVKDEKELIEYLNGFEITGNIHDE